jgi:hypothetical protein
MIVEDPSLTLQCIYHSEYLLGICIVQPEGSMHHQTSQSVVLVHQIFWSPGCDPATSYETELTLFLHLRGLLCCVRAEIQ